MKWGHAQQKERRAQVSNAGSILDLSHLRHSISDELWQAAQKQGVVLSDLGGEEPVGAGWSRGAGRAGGSRGASRGRVEQGRQGEPATNRDLKGSLWACTLKEATLPTPLLPPPPAAS